MLSPRRGGLAGATCGLMALPRGLARAAAAVGRFLSLSIRTVVMPCSHVG